ncbi:MAG: glycosyltransferase family A protein [Thermoplasmataceae archaeon]
MSQNEMQRVDVLIRTFNSADTLSDCLQSVLKFIPIRKIIVADHNSTDGTPEIARRFGAEVYTEETGLGFATKLLISKADTRYILFVDGDITVTSSDFFERAAGLFDDPRTGAVVGCAVDHDFLYGIPLGLTMLSLDLARKIEMPDVIQGRETFYFEEILSRASLKVRYIRDTMIHRSTYRKYRYWPEWQGAQIRLTPSRHFSQLLGAIFVVYMMHLNSKSARNFLYSPIYYVKIVSGFLNPEKWGNVDRRKIANAIRE